MTRIDYKDLYDLLVCPACRGELRRAPTTLTCLACSRQYPIVDGVPILLPQGWDPAVAHEGELQVSEVYNPWIYRMIMQSLLDDQIVVEVGAGNVALDDPCIIRTDVVLSPHVDVVADLHALPFRSDAIGFVFSRAVFEHLRNPFDAAAEVHRVLRDGGWTYHECNFVFPYHGYPHHYFNASAQGMEQVFASFDVVRAGVAPFQMPSFALEGLINAYMSRSAAGGHLHGEALLADLRALLDHDLRSHDIYFDQDNASFVAAGTYIAGRKQVRPDASVVPTPILAAVAGDPGLAERFPEPHDLTEPDNVLWWAQHEGREVPDVAAALDDVTPFNKRGPQAPWNRDWLRELPAFESRFAAMGFPHDATLEENVALATTAVPPSLGGWPAVANHHHDLVGASVLRADGGPPDEWRAAGGLVDVAAHPSDWSAGRYDVAVWIGDDEVAQHLPALRRALRPDGVALVVIPNRLQSATFARLRRRATAAGFRLELLDPSVHGALWPTTRDRPVVTRLSQHRLAKFVAPTRHVAALLWPA